MKKGVRGNNKVSKLLNKEVGWKLGKKQKTFISVIAYSLFYILIFIAASRYFGFRDGIIITLGIALAILLGEHQRKQGGKIIKKHPWKAFDDNE